MGMLALGFIHSDNWSYLVVIELIMRGSIELIRHIKARLNPTKT